MKDSETRVACFRVARPGGPPGTAGLSGFEILNARMDALERRMDALESRMRLLLGLQVLTLGLVLAPYLAALFNR